MHTPDAHPNTNPDTAGKGRRYVLQTYSIRPVRLDSRSDAALLWSQAQLSVTGNPRDAASVSMIVRRAVRLYERFLCRFLEEPCALEAERKAVRELSQMPGRKRKRARV